MYITGMITQIDALLILADTYSTHEKISDWAMSKRVAGKGNFFSRLRAGCDTGARTARRIVQNFSNIWPIDLEWPTEIERPTPASKSLEARDAS